MSKGDDLRGFVTERLAAAAQEILTAVARTVAGYEEEASGFRQEIEQQRRQLEVLLRRQLRFGRAAVECSRSLGPVEEEQLEDQEDSMNQASSSPPSTQNKKRKSGRPRSSETQNHVDVRIRILEHSDTAVLSNSVLKRCPMLKLRCPRGLKENDFLDLLRSTFPQLSGENSFDILTPDERRRLQLVNIKTVDIRGNISCRGWTKSTLYIRPRTPKEPKACEEEIHQRTDTADVPMCDQTRRTESGPVQEVQGSSFVSRSLTTNQKEEPEVANDEVRAIAGPSVGDHSHAVGKPGERREVNDSDGDWNPDKSNERLKQNNSELQSKTQRARCSGVEAIQMSTDVVFSCKVCGALRESEAAFVKHAGSHTDDPGRVCGVCGEPSESTELLKDHLQSHMCECHICGESFLSLLSLSDRPYECKVCRDANSLVSLEGQQNLHKDQKVLELEEELKDHFGTPTKRRTYLCGECGKSLCDYRSLCRHRMTHSEERPHGCQVCGRRFKLPWTLRQHEKIHTDRERSYLCDVCCKMFLTSKQLQIHLRTHTNEKPYHCGECGKGFTTKGPLTIHMRVHTGETPYRCPDCGWSFKRKCHLDNHMRVHSGNKPFVCGICGKACARKTYLTVHMRTHNGERPYKCTICDKGFTQSHCLKTHLKSHRMEAAAT